MNQALGFLISIVIVIFVFVVSATAAGLFAETLGLWKKPIIGAVAAACVVFSAYVSAPRYKLLSAAIWLIIGAISAWVLSSIFMYAEDAATSLPLYITYTSGLVTLMACTIWHKKHIGDVLR
ncbi:hypothetical protein [Pseudoalteromonas luteoviolacea]|uniref:Major facilitator superfamily (MFS) profile domain-containing protein n=1 Tax=Pseudoalteromonas luteoviolacea DSM 6061 TaxID=1365250 RepID=A0A166VYB1_9GAMM|nr:hypothetical protein [Pseudoalteromonas luteoviolacea]KZN34409.1 hypothetical protein N475_19210 [Pseudoalteromonas luteoviolacea DSM 6061]MBE0389873.1 hypothetical protein [Pseudoalteromonas luteoviolacea DSM 6061]